MINVFEDGDVSYRFLKRSYHSALVSKRPAGGVRSGHVSHGLHDQQNFTQWPFFLIKNTMILGQKLVFILESQTIFLSYS